MNEDVLPAALLAALAASGNNRAFRANTILIHEGDVGAVIAHPGRSFDAILLDVDNGPDGLVRAENDSLYSPRGLAAARVALTPGGLLAIWSAAPDARFAKRLRDGFAVEESVVAARVGGKGPRHVIWYATRA